MSNDKPSGGKVCRPSTQNEWAAYDNLSTSAKRALQDAEFNWSAYSVARAIRAGIYQPYEVPKRVRIWDRDRRKRLNRNRAAPD